MIRGEASNTKRAGGNISAPQTGKHFLEIVSRSASRTRRIGALTGELAAPGDVILLVGPLGAGKTCLVQGVAAGLNIRENVASPSFVLIREYQGRIPLYHIDLYRLERVEEASELGIEDYCYGRGICMVEWADRALSLFPEDRLLVEMNYVSSSKRNLRFFPSGGRHEYLVSQLASRISFVECC